ncbi:MAG: hypothetical protein QOG87_3177 [Actinomycetota bacterium]
MVGFLAWLRGRSAWIVVPICAPIGIFWSALTGQQGLAPNDGYRYYLPLRLVAGRVWRTGHIPVWNPFEYSGYPLLANGQTAVLYPLNAVLVLSPSVRAFNVVTVAHFVIAGIGAYLLARKMTGDVIGATVAAASFGLSGFLFAHVGHHAIIASAAWLPWCFLGYELVVEKITPGRVLLGAGAVAMTLLAGHPQTWFVLLAALAGYALLQAVLDQSRRAARLVAAAALVLGLGACLAAVQLLPTASIVDESDRSTVDYETAVSFSLSPADLPLLVFPMEYGGYARGLFDEPYKGPWNFHELAAYPTAAALVLAVAGLTAARRDRRVLAAAAVGLAAVVVALGGSTPLGKVVYNLAPYGQFRAWSRYLVFFDLAVAILAAYGVAQLRSETARQRRGAVVAAFTSAALIVGTALVLPLVGNEHRAAGRHLLLALTWPAAAAVGVAVVALLVVRRPSFAAAGLVAIVVADALMLGWHTEWRGPPSVAALERMLSGEVTPSYGPVTDVAGGIDRYIYLGNRPDKVPDFVSTTDAKGMYAASGYDPLAPRRYLASAAGMTTYGGALDGAGVWNQGSDLLDLLRISVVLTTSREPQPDPATSLLGAGTPVRGTSVIRYEHRPRLPEAYIVGQVRQVRSADVVRAVRGDVAFDPVEHAIVDETCGVCRGLDQPGSAGTAAVVKRAANALDMRVRADRRGMLVVSQGWFPGWRATVDGRAVELHRVNGMLNGLVVDPGSHTVKLSYRAPGLRAGALVSLLTLLGLVAWAGVARTVDRPWRNARHAKGRGSLRAQWPQRQEQNDRPLLRR